MIRQPEKPSVIKAAALVSFGTISSRILGFVRDAFLLAFFSPLVTDAFAAAFRLPNLVRRLLSEGAISVSLIPAVVGSKSSASSKHLQDALFGLLCVWSGLASVFLFIFAQPLLKFWLGPQTGLGQSMELTLTMFRVMSLYIFLISNYAFLAAIAQSQGLFLVAALAPALFNLVVIVFVWTSPPLGEHLAWGVLIGAALQSLMVAVRLAWKSALPRFSVNWCAKEVGYVLRGFVPSLLSLGVFHLGGVISFYFASRAGTGNLSILFAADRLLELPQALVASSLATALLPAYSRAWSLGEVEDAGAMMNRSLRAMFFLALPASAGLFILSPLIINVLFRHGNFDAESAAFCAEVVAIYSLALPFLGCAKLLSQAFYATRRPGLAAGIALLALLAHVGLLVFGVFEKTLIGLAWAAVFAAAFHSLALGVIFQKKWGLLEFSSLAQASFRWLPGLVLMCGFTYVVRGLVSLDSSLMVKLCGLGAAVSGGAFFYLRVAADMRAPELNQARFLRP